MLNNSENPANAEMPIVINTPGWVKGLFVLKKILFSVHYFWLFFLLDIQLQYLSIILFSLHVRHWL